MRVPEYMPKVEEVMEDLKIEEKDLREAMRGKNGKVATGEDQVTYTILRQAMANEKIAKYTTDAINRVLNGEDDIPAEWGDIRIRLIYKGKGEIRTFDNYRPLAITCILEKVLHTVLKEKMLAHCRRSTRRNPSGMTPMTRPWPPLRS